MRAIGIDIGSSSIKVVEAVSTSKSVQIVSFIEHPLGQNPAYDPELEIHEFLQNIAAQYDSSQTKVVMGLRQERVSLRHKIFPFSDRMKILKSLPFELEEDIPFSSETAIYEARTIRYLGNQAEVLACATPKHRIQELLEKYQSAGLTITNLSVEGLAFANCFEHWSEPIPQEPAVPPALDEQPAPTRLLKLVVQMGHTHTLVAAFDQSRLVAVRSILWGGKNVADAISRKYEIPYVEAIREMRTKAFILPSKEEASYDQVVFSDTISSQFRDLGRELKLTILEIETELNGQIMSAELTGGLSGVQNVCAFVTQLIEVPVNLTNYLAHFSTSFEKSAILEGTIGTALGLAIEGLRKPRNPAIQFLRGEFAPQNESLQVFWLTWGSSIRVAAALFVILFAYAEAREALTSSLNDQSDEVMKNQAKVVAHLPARQQTEAGVKKYIRDKRKHAQDMKSLEGLAHMNSALEIMKKISDAAPARASGTLIVQSVRIEDQQVTILGTAGNAQDKASLQKALQNVSRDGKVSPTATASATSSGVLGVPFGFIFSVDRGVQ